MSERETWNDEPIGRVLTGILENERYVFSELLGPDGQNLKYERHQIGFDLTPRQARSK